LCSVCALGPGDRHIAEAEKLIAEQRATLAELERDDYEARAARDVLDAMIERVRQMQAHHALIVAEGEHGQPGTRATRQGMRRLHHVRDAHALPFRWELAAYSCV
jgi:hypothetical protein